MKIKNDDGTWNQEWLDYIARRAQAARARRDAAEEKRLGPAGPDPFQILLDAS